jgi:hypothetical protein
MSEHDCPACPETFPNRASLLDHVRNEHDVLTPEKLEGEDER